MTGRLTTTILSEWVKSRLSVVEPRVMVTVGRPPDTPDRVVTISRSGGPGEQMQGLFEAVNWQFRTRGAQNSLDDAEKLTYKVDDIMRELQTTLVGDVYVLSTQWAGSGPQQIFITDSQSRFNFSCSYIIRSDLR